MKRGTIVFACFVLVALVVAGRLFFLQVQKHGFYKALAQGQQENSSLQKGDRGSILLKDKNGNTAIAATNQFIPFVFVSPAEVEDEIAAADVLSSVLALNKNSILAKLKDKESLYQLISKQVSKEQANAIAQKNLKGVYVQEQMVRGYPQDTLAAQVVGFVNQEGVGQYGIEKYYDDELGGKEGIQKNAQNPASYLFSALGETVQNGADVTLTLDQNIQAAAELALGKAKETLNVQEGTIIVIDPKSGKILALANLPLFDPNEYTKVKNFQVFQNAAVEQIFEPGSVFKAITMASALDAGAVSPDTTYIDKGILKIGGYSIYNYGNRVWGEQTMKGVLDFSINTGAAFAQDQLGNTRFLQYIKKFGILDPTGVDLPGEIYSQNSGLLQGHEINFATASFGQGIEMTSMQLARAYSAIANGGRLPKPFIVEGAEQKLSDPVISQQTATTLTSMLVDVIENGYGKAAKIPGYYVAGKTGTAQIPFTALGIQKAGYSDKTIQSFVGYGPAYNPRFLVLIKLNNPQAKTAEYSAVPLFRDLAKYIINYLEIPPDYEVK